MMVMGAGGVGMWVCKLGFVVLFCFAFGIGAWHMLGKGSTT
jgi:hypothetical protein